MVLHNWRSQKSILASSFGTEAFYCHLEKRPKPHINLQGGSAFFLTPAYPEDPASTVCTQVYQSLRESFQKRYIPRTSAGHSRAHKATLPGDIGVITEHFSPYYTFSDVDA
ncbi:hypothetical protein BaRGS_00006250 [Batillaria attramentaria]|uniref:Uncharacterized protein n=1 Tax=Batillaria attramentaria TaxID=370345 RepID=A0ABD0LSG3_9CAEN